MYQYEHPLGVKAKCWVDAIDPSIYHWHVKVGSKVLASGVALTLEDGRAVIDVWFIQNRPKLYLIQHGVLRMRAFGRRRVRQYAYTAECWERHEQKERERLISDLWKGVYQLFTEKADQDAYQSMPLRDRTRYEKLLDEPHPLTPEQWQFGIGFVKAWKKKAGRCD
jgi:hypothetical protein